LWVLPGSIPSTIWSLCSSTPDFLLPSARRENVWRGTCGDKVRIHQLVCSEVREVGIRKDKMSLSGTYLFSGEEIQSQ
jgi:hypothetical protein